MAANGYTPTEFLDKCNWEGGVLEAIAGYELKHSDVSPDYPDFRNTVQRIEEALRGVQADVSRLHEYYDG